MSLRKISFWGQRARVTMMELRTEPGEIFDRVKRGMVIEVTKSGKVVGVISPPPLLGDADCIVHSDGSWEGERPIMIGQRP